jgi:hypothetical protein
MYLQDFDITFDKYVHKAGNITAYPLTKQGDKLLCLLFFNYKWHRGYAIKTRLIENFEKFYILEECNFVSKSYYYYQYDKRGYSSKLSFEIPDRDIAWGKNKLPFLSFNFGKNANSDKYHSNVKFTINTVGTPRSFMKPLSEVFDVETYDIELRKQIGQLILSCQTENIILAANMMNLINY